MGGQEVIVAGLGAVGSAALYQLARRGTRALGIDRWAPPHAMGSSHGETRITRLALGEGSQYVQFARRSHEIWRELEAATGATLLRAVGCLVYGAEDSRGSAHGAGDFLQTTIDVARQHGIDHQVLDAAALRQRFPQFRWRGDERGCLEPGGGFVHPEACVDAQLTVAQGLGARIRTDERVVGWSADAGGVSVTTDRGTHRADRLILATGAWLPAMVPHLGARVRLYRQVMGWFRPDGEAAEFAAGAMPVYVRLPDAGSAMLYGFPAVDPADPALKVAGEQFDVPSAADAVEPSVSDAEQAALFALAAPHLRITAPCVRALACRYAVTPDFHFIIDRVAPFAPVWFASACSGHGFKHSAAVGEALAELAIDSRTRFDLTGFAFRPWRLGGDPS